MRIHASGIALAEAFAKSRTWAMLLKTIDVFPTGTPVSVRKCSNTFAGDIFVLFFRVSYDALRDFFYDVGASV